MLFFYPLRLTPLFMIFMTSWVLWLALTDIILGLLSIIAFIFFVFGFAKYLFAVLERTANGYPDPPPFSYELIRPFEEWRPYQLLFVMACMFTLSGWLKDQDLVVLSNLVLAISLAALPAIIGLLGVKFSLLQSLNPLALARFMLRVGSTYWVMLGLFAAGYVLLVVLYHSATGLFVTLFINLYSLVLVFHWLGKSIYAKRTELDYHPDKSPEREAEQTAFETIKKRKKCLGSIYAQRHKINGLPILLAHIDGEENGLEAHAWFHDELMQWDDKRLALDHGHFYITALRAASIHDIANQIQRDFQDIDPEFSCDKQGSDPNQCKKH